MAETLSAAHAPTWFRSGNRARAELPAEGRQTVRASTTMACSRVIFSFGPMRLLEYPAKVPMWTAWAM